nr:MAG TPA: hypothetical protein [Caudoviricetes sp.]
MGDKRISDSRRGYFALGCCDRAYGGLKRRLGEIDDVREVAEMRPLR